MNSKNKKAKINGILKSLDSDPTPDRQNGDNDSLFNTFNKSNTTNKIPPKTDIYELLPRSDSALIEYHSINNSVMKTYCNPRVFTKRNNIIESFSLPDIPSFMAKNVDDNQLDVRVVDIEEVTVGKYQDFDEPWILKSIKPNGEFSDCDTDLKEVNSDSHCLESPQVPMKSTAIRKPAISPICILDKERVLKTPIKRTRQKRVFENVGRHLRSSGCLDLLKNLDQITVSTPKPKQEHRLLRSRSQELVKEISSESLNCNDKKKRWNSFPSENIKNELHTPNSTVARFSPDKSKIVLMNGNSNTPISNQKSAINGFKSKTNTWRGIKVPKGKRWNGIKSEAILPDSPTVLTDNGHLEVSFGHQPDTPIGSFIRKRGRPSKSIINRSKRIINSVDLTGDLEVSFNSYGNDNASSSNTSSPKSRNKSSTPQSSPDVKKKIDVGNGKFLSELFVKITRSKTSLELQKSLDVLLSSEKTSDRILRSRSSSLNSEVKEETRSFLEVSSSGISTTPEKKKGSGEEIEQVPIKYEEGSIMWAQLGKSPYWPCIIIKDKEINQYKKETTRRRQRLFYYHVIFFGDHKRAWVNEKKLMPYINSKDLQLMYQQKKDEGKLFNELKAYTIPRGISDRWLNSVTEADLCNRKRDKEKIKYIKNMLKPIVIEATLDKETENKPLTVTKHRLSRPSLPQKKRIRVKSESAESVNVKKGDSLNDSSITENYIPMKKEEPPDQDTSETKPKRVSIPLTLEPITLQSQKILHRRNNLFRGVPKERACHYCGTLDKVLKCRGCFTPYHLECAKRVFLNKPFHGRKPPKTVIKVKEEVTKSKSFNVKSVKDKSDNPGKVSVYNLFPTKDFPDTCQGMSVMEKLDYKLEELMKPFADFTIYCSPEELEENDTIERDVLKRTTAKTEFPVKSKPSFRHVTADSDVQVDGTRQTAADGIVPNPKNFKCGFCSSSISPYCMVCHMPASKTGSVIRQKCSQHQCGRYYHPECLKQWPQTQWSLIQKTKHKDSEQALDNFICPSHVCHTCVSGDPRSTSSHCPPNMVARCVRCPSTYHSSNFCVPAGSKILSASQIICPKHKKQRPVNTTWCFICSEGGDLFCCEFCPTSVHAECMPVDIIDGKFICEDCQSGRMPLYDEIVWVKLGSYKWWPAVILFPNEVPSNVMNSRHSIGDFVVMFFGTYNHRWVNRSRTFLFQEGDEEQTKEQAKGKLVDAFMRSIEEASAAHKVKTEFRTQEAGSINAAKPPPYIKLKVNKPVGNVRQMEMNLSNTTPCECDPNQPNPCGPDSNCLNRLLWTECNPEVCPAGKMCNNQLFEKRDYPLLTPYKTDSRGWGLKTLVPINKGQFVIEYVGEVIDDVEYQRRVQKMHEQKESNYYFLTITKDRMIDAGPKGNVARFMNHCCQPNCETQKWTVNGDTRVGLFATDDIPAGSELNFNYNLECIGEEKKICKCGAPNCSGFIGVKAKQLSQESQSDVKRPRKAYKKKKTIEQSVLPPCFVCGKKGNVGLCNNKTCNKAYHLRCLNMTSWPDGNKFICSWHSCNVCSKRTIRCCVKCINSYCPSHSKGNIRHDNLLGFVCSNHDTSISNDTKSDVASKDNESHVDEDSDGEDNLSLLQRLRSSFQKTDRKVKNQSSTANIGISSQS